MLKKYNVKKFYPKDFDFIASSLARMNSQGHKVNVEQVTDGMNEVCKSRFLRNYHYHVNIFAKECIF